MRQALLVHPPIFDFTAYDFWLRPYGMLRVAGKLKGSFELSYFDYLAATKRDSWGRGPYPSREVAKPKCLKDIPRRFHRFGRSRTEFRELLTARSFDAVFVQTMMTYWYSGVREVIEDVRELQPSAKIVLGGVYATLCTEHAQSLDPDLVVKGSDLSPLWQLLSIEPVNAIPIIRQDTGSVGVVKISEGCPFQCSYCSASILYPDFRLRPTVDCLEEFRQLAESGVRNVAFYDDALIFDAESGLIPFLEGVVRLNTSVSFHTPNALNARFMTADLARLMVGAGFAGFFFGLESSNLSWQRSTGGKVNAEEFTAAVRYLKEAGAESVFTYIIVGHPDSACQDVELSMRLAHQCGTKIILSEFSPIPGTADGERCGKWADLDEPLSHNKTAFAIRRLGRDYLNGLKSIRHTLNAELGNREL